MSLRCHEDGGGLQATQEAYCVTIRSADTYSAICQDHYRTIPLEERLPEPVEGGLDIHFLFSKPTHGSRLDLPNLLTLRDAEFGEYRFSIASDAARLLLPKCSELYLGSA